MYYLKKKKQNWLLRGICEYIAKIHPDLTPEWSSK